MKLITATCLYFISSILLFSQEKFIPKLAIGINSGISHANVIFQDPIDAQPVNALGNGFFMSYISEPHFGIQLEVDYAPRGWKEEGNDTIVGYERRMSYLQFPILSKISFGQKLVRVNFELGPYIAFLREDYEGYHSKYDINYETDYDTLIGLKPVYIKYDRYGNDFDNKFDYGFILGGGVGFNLPVGELGLQFRYSLGLAQLFIQYPTGDFEFSQIQNYYLGISYSYAIKLRKSPK